MSPNLQKDDVIKAARKKLAKQESGRMKLKALSKVVLKKIVSTTSNGEEDATGKVEKWIQQSKKFEINDNIVSLKRKRSDSDGKGSQETMNDDGNEESKPTHSKKEKKRASQEDEGQVDKVSTKNKPKKREVKEGTTVASTSNGTVSSWRMENRIVLLHTGPANTNEIPLDTVKEYFPFCEFKQAEQAISEPLLKHCTEVKGFAEPSPIQAQAWPILTHKPKAGNGQQRRRDLVGIAETGSGKTLAFALPALSALTSTAKKDKKKVWNRLPRMLVLAPTRELAMQSAEVLEEFGAVVGLSTLVVYGGVPKYTQTTQLKQRSVDCIVATPGRLKDLINERSCDLSAIEQLVLDEADRMLDMGFEEDVRYIIACCKETSEGRQTAMFSATWPASIQRIAMEFMIDPIRLYVGFDTISSNDASGEEAGTNSQAADVDDSLSANKRVTQNIEVIEDRERDVRLKALLRQIHKKNSNDRVLVFALYKKEAARLEHVLLREGYKCCSIHGNKTQDARTAALKQFKEGSCPLLIATDVAARGLDIPNVEVVINFTFPLTVEDYVHRIGRTGRAGKYGVSYTFFQPSDKGHAGALQQVLRQAGQPIPDELMKFGSTIKKKEHKLYGNFGPQSNSVPMKKATKITFNYSDEEE